jgi:hypothetical protein
MFGFSSTASLTRVIIKTGNWILSRSGNALLISGSAYTWSDTAGTITISDTGNNAKTFAGGGQSFNNLSITGGGTGEIIFTGANIFKKITVNSPKTITLPSGVNTQVGQFVAYGTLGNLITLNASTPGSAATLTKTGGGVIQCQYLDITDINVAPANSWFYGNSSVSTYHSGTGWGVEAPNFFFLL